MADPLTLAIDVGGTHLKAGLLSIEGKMTLEAQRVDTPHPATPAAVIAALTGMITPLGPFQRISIGFPGVVRGGKVLTAPNLGTDAWRGFDLAHALAQKFHAPVRLSNDGTVQGLGVITGHGLECVITLGTGMGFALFENGRPGPHLELAHHPVHDGKDYDQWIGDAALKDAGRKRWNRRVQKSIGYIATLTNYDILYIGGGNSRHVQGDLPENVKLVSNEAGITGGIKLWDPKLDAMFPAT